MKRHLIALTMVVLLLPPIAYGQGCGIRCLSSADTQILEQGRNTTRSFLEDVKKFESEAPPTSPVTAALALRRMAGWTREYYEEYRDFRRKTSNQHLARYFGRLARTFQELSETATAGASLLDAVQSNNASLLQGVSEALAYSEAKRLVSPVSSHLELQTRIREFQVLMERKSKELEREVTLAGVQLREASGIEF